MHLPNKFSNIIEEVSFNWNEVTNIKNARRQK